MKRVQVPQGLRYAFLLIELITLSLGNRLAFGSWLPSTEPSGFWFYAALFGLLLGQRLDTPFFTAPKDAVLYAIPALVAALQVPTSVWADGSQWGANARVLAIAWISLVLVVSSCAVWLQHSRWDALKRTGNAALQISSSLGDPRAFFSVILFLVVLAFPPMSIEAVLGLALVWAVTVPFSLLDFLYRLWRRVRLSIARGSDTETLEIASFQEPGLLTVRANRQASMPVGSVLAYRDSARTPQLALVIAPAGRDSGELARAARLGAATSRLPGIGFLGDSEIIVVSDAVLSAPQIEVARAFRSDCIGVVAPETDINRLIIEITAEKDLAAGRLTSTTSGKQRVYYQLTNGLTKEEIVQQKNSFGFVAAHARSVGVWDEQGARLKPASWVPSPNAPVFLVELSSGHFALDQIGTFPGTDFGVRLRDIRHLVTHNTAILGILGVGKSTLAMELVERVLKEGCKVLVLDLTDQYATELADLLNAGLNASVTAKLQAVGAPGKTNVKQNVEEGGSRRVFAQTTEAALDAFLSSDKRLLVLNPASFEVWRQDSKPFQGSASMASLTACEITHIISDAALRVVQKAGRTDAPRLCLVYEEAHSLVPEWNATVSEGDRTAANGTARAILQGRKYGLGCFLVTQRTASVTKTILNQCNSVFAMRSFDDTSKEFLSNYIGREYAALLPTLPERHAVFFGRASSCENPVHIQLNDRADFIAGFRRISPSSD